MGKPISGSCSNCFTQAVELSKLVAALTSLLIAVGTIVTVIRIACASALVVLVCVGSLFAGPYSELIVFGDSLSDAGNLHEKTDEPFFQLFFGDPIPPPPYFDGRFSNGPVYCEILADALGLAPLTPSVFGGNDYAHGNAMTSGTGAILSAYIDDIDDQVSDYVATRTPSPSALFVIFAGANDLLGEQTDVNVPVESLINSINELIDDGAQNFLVANLPWLGLTPRFNMDPNETIEKNSITATFNAELESQLDLLEASALGVNLFRLDVEQLINNAVANPAAFGFSNVTDPAAPGLNYDVYDYDPNLIVDDPNTYLFWDELHPTSAAHALLAEYALNAVTYSADFNFDGQVNGFDLATWELSYGVNALADADGDGDSDGEDFLQWQLQYGSGFSALTVGGGLVPEPHSSFLLILGFMAVGRRSH